jgi:hypothetical protein
MPRLWLFILFSALAVLSKAQVATITGLVTADNQRQNGAIVKNISTRAQAMSNDIGEFSIRATVGDTIVTLKPDYNNDTLLVASTPYYIICLKRSPTMLKEVIVMDKALTPEKILKENKETYKEIYRKGDESHAVVITPLGVGVVIDKVWSAVSKEGKDARKMQRRLTTDYRSATVDRRFTKNLVTRVTGYKGIRLDDFMVKYRPTFEMVNKWNNYELIEYIKAKLAADRDKKEHNRI